MSMPKNSNKPVVTTNPTLARLQRDCSRALDRYTRASERARVFMTQAKESPLGVDQRERLLEHLRSETRTHDAYMRARRQLWSLLTGTAQRQAHVLKCAA